jgi:hypothetical protein
LEALVSWVVTAAAFALRYPDLSQGLAEVAAAFGRFP